MRRTERSLYGAALRSALLLNSLSLVQQPCVGGSWTLLYVVVAARFCAGLAVCNKQADTDGHHESAGPTIEAMLPLAHALNYYRPIYISFTSVHYYFTQYSTIPCAIFRPLCWLYWSNKIYSLSLVVPVIYYAANYSQYNPKWM